MQSLRVARRLVLPLVYLFAFALPPLLAGVAGVRMKSEDIAGGAPAVLQQALPPHPSHDPSKPTAVVLAGNKATESSDFLAPYEVLGTSGAFNLYAVAPERRPSPMFPGNVDILPHFSFAEYEQLIGTPPDLLVIPFIPNATAEDAAILSWIPRHVGERTTILTICAGSAVLAETGLLAGRTSTTYHDVLPMVERTHPEVNWVRDVRWVDDGNIIASAGIVSGVDATLHTLDRLFDRQMADDVARKLGYPHTRFMDNPAFPTPVGNMMAPALSWAYRWERTDMGIALYPGVSELALASIADTYPRSFAARMHTLTPDGQMIRSRNGLDILPRFSLQDAPALDRLLIPGSPDAAAAGTFEQWAQRRSGLKLERIHASGQYPYDATIADMARGFTNALAAQAATGIEYPTGHFQLGGAAWPYDLLVRPVALAALGLSAAVWLTRRRSARPAPVAA